MSIQQGMRIRGLTWLLCLLLLVLAGYTLYGGSLVPGQDPATV